MARTGPSINSTSGRQRACQPQSQKLMDNEISELKNYLPEWTSAKRSEKRGVFAALARAARLFAPKVDQKQWKKRKQVMCQCCVEKLNFNIVYFHELLDVQDLVVQQQEKEGKEGHDQVWKEMDAQDGGLPAEM
jgi:hypothetical protein